MYILVKPCLLVVYYSSTCGPICFSVEFFSTFLLSTWEDSMSSLLLSKTHVQSQQNSKTQNNKNLEHSPLPITPKTANLWGDITIINLSITFKFSKKFPPLIFCNAKQHTIVVYTNVQNMQRRTIFFATFSQSLSFFFLHICTNHNNSCYSTHVCLQNPQKLKLFCNFRFCWHVIRPSEVEP